MATLVTMPRYGANMTQGTVSAWHIAEGAAVEKGDVIADISIEKLSNELCAPESGTVIKLLAEEGDELPCGAAIAVIGQAGEPYEHLLDALELPSVSAGGTSPAAQPSRPQGEEQPQAPGPEPASCGVTPKAAKLAQELGLDLRGIQGTGRHQLITREDVRAAAAARVQVQQAPVSPPAAHGKRTRPL